MFIPAIFKGISCFRCELHTWWWRWGWDLIRCTINLVVFILMLCEMLSQFILRKSEYFLCLNESVTEASDIEKKPSATELRQQEWIEANCGNIRLSEHGFNATDCCPHRLNKNPLLNRVYNLWTTCYPQWKQNRGSGVRRLPQCPAARWICVCITLFVHKLVMCFCVASLWRILRALKDGHVTLKNTYWLK